jgi:CBS domain containing-hemolysin-like protein
MIILWVWAIVVLALVSATVCATADSALLAFHASGTATVSDVGLADRERNHRALSMGRVLSYITAGAALARGLSLGQIELVPRALATALAAVVVCTIAEGFGRSIGYANPPAVHSRLAPFVRLVSFVLRPAVAFGAAIDRTLHAIIPPTARDPEEREASAEQFREVVTAEADVSSAEEELIHGVFSLGETEVQEIMVPRVDIVGIEVGTRWSEVLDRIRSSEHARLPVFRDTLDEVVGILYAKDVLPSIVADQEPPSGWPSLVRPPSFIPTSKRIDAQLREFQASRTHIAIVSDEYGGTAGLVTIEDILEEIVGEIRDEYDVEEPSFQQEGFGRYWVSGRMPVDELSERLNANLAIDDVTTVGGLVYALFGRVPKSGEAHLHAGFRIVVERVRRRRIERVYFERLEPVGSTETE